MDVIKSNDGRLNQTLYTQPSIFVVSTLIWRALQSTVNPRVHAALGFSLGEYAALAATEVFSDTDMLHLIQVRALAMQEASIQQPGKMAAILGLSFRLNLLPLQSKTKSLSFVRLYSNNNPTHFKPSLRNEQVRHLKKKWMQKFCCMEPIYTNVYSY